MAFKFSVRLNLGLTIVGALFCLTPLFTLKIGKSYSTDDVAYPRIKGAIPEPSVPILASFFMILIPAADLMIDLSSNIASFCLFKKTAVIDKSLNGAVVTRLSDVERLIFILGVTMQSGLWFLPSNTGEIILGLNEMCIMNCSVILLLGPIIMYLERCTTSFTETLSVAMLFILVLGLFCTTASLYFRDERPTYSGLVFAGGICVVITGTLFLLTVLLCVYRSYSRILVIKLHKLNCLPGIYQSSKIEESGIQDDDEDQIIFRNDMMYTHYIPFLHIVSILIISAANYAVKYSKDRSRQESMTIKHFITLAAETMVLVLEYRIRKNEIARGLIALLESKKSYVRYISHELRTPLNTVFLGLKLLTCEMKASTDAKDIERYDTLCDVNMSCMAAVDILNDLLCYEKLDSGILILHKEKVTVLPFITECVSMFSVQARECGVAMIVSPGVSVDDIGTSEDNGALTSHPLMSHDAIFIDKFKMDQVIRNLISNALKFTPRGGIVTVDVSFVESHPTTSHQITNGADVRKYLPHTEPHAGSHSKLRFQSKSQLQSSPIRGVNKSGKIRRLSTTQNVNETWGESDPSSVDGKLVLVVTDTGAGISPENQNKLFKDIVQFSPEKLQAGGGSGLGLWISGGIVDLHDGKISVHSEGEGMGSSFTVEIPMIRVTSPLPSPSRQSQDDDDNLSVKNTTLSLDLDVTLIAAPAMTPVLEVLVVDDSRLNRKMLLKVLNKDGHRCTEAEDGLEAIERVKERIDFSNGGHGKPYDAILMDFIMPNMDGPTAVKHIRSMGYKAPIFGVTGNALPADIEYFLQRGADKVILKPLNIDAFENAMKEIKRRK